jgi:hypothetical protein
MFRDVRGAIAREKEIKGWSRAKKKALIEERNSTWEDLAERFFEGIREKQVPRFARDDSFEVPGKRVKRYDKSVNCHSKPSEESAVVFEARETSGE